uniref:Uncharacterized protein n=1 Tax=Arundo donax TaxID=35708 RepID=A0A0A8ZVV1_ARUDO
MMALNMFMSLMFPPGLFMSSEDL